MTTEQMHKAAIGAASAFKELAEAQRKASAASQRLSEVRTVMSSARDMLADCVCPNRRVRAFAVGEMTVVVMYTRAGDVELDVVDTERAA